MTDEALPSWHVGQTVVVGYPPALDTIDRLTARQAVTTRGSRFWLKDGRGIGGWSQWLASASPAAIERERRREVIIKLLNFPWDRVPALATLQDIHQQARDAAGAGK